MSLEFFSGRLAISKLTWHYRAYRWWERTTGGNSSGYKENFCHYCRVVFLWTPILWLFKGHAWRGITPWKLLATTIVTLALLISAVIWPEALWRFIGKVFFMVAIGLLVALLIGILVFIARRYKGKIETVIGILLAVVFSPIWVPVVYLIIPLSDRFHTKYIAPTGKTTAQWFFLTYRWKVVAPWTVVALVASLLGSYSFSLSVVLKVWAVIVISTVALGALALVAIGLVLLNEHFSNRRQERRYQKEREELLKRDITVPVDAAVATDDQSSSTLSILWKSIMAAKRKVCPLIVFSDENAIAA